MIKLLSISFPPSYLCVCVLRAPEIYSLHDFSGFILVLTAVTMLYVRPLDLSTLQNCNVFMFDQHLPTVPITGPW